MVSKFILFVFDIAQSQGHEYKGVVWRRCINKIEFVKEMISVIPFFASRPHTMHTRFLPLWHQSLQIGLKNYT